MESKLVQAQYIIAEMMMQSNSTQITLSNLNHYGICVRNLSVERNTGYAFLTSRQEIWSAVLDYPDYFEPACDADKKFVSIKLQSNKSITDLRDSLMPMLTSEAKMLLDEAWDIYLTEQ